MPRNVRNFWIQLDVDGKKERITTGPRNKDGGFEMTILIREKGAISNKKLEVRGYVSKTGKLILSAHIDGEHNPALAIAMER